MSDYTASMAGRELGALPLSVGTSLAFEALQQEKPQNYASVHINLHTLFRNMHGALPAIVASETPTPVWVKALVEEMLIIKQVMGQYSQNLEVLFYCPTYATLPKELPKALLRPMKTDNQLRYLAIQTDVLSNGFKQVVPTLERQGLKFVYTDNGPTKIKQRAILVTHHMVDLLKTVWDTRLLESHTGKIKDRSMWYTKFAGSMDHSRIPFNKLTLTVLGDPTLIAPHPLAVRKALYALAEEKKWTPASTYDLVRFSVDHMRDYGIRDLFRAMF